MATNTIAVILRQLAKMIDHSLLHPTMTDVDTLEGLKIARESNVATAGIKPYLIPLAKRELAGSDVLASGDEIDIVVNVGKILSGNWEYVTRETRLINEAVTSEGAILKAISENDYLKPRHIVRLCQVCTELGVAFVKKSTGYGFVKLVDGSYDYRGATVKDLKLIREIHGKDIQIKAAGGVRSLDDLLHVMTLGATRIGATATVVILQEAKSRGIGDEPIEVSFQHINEDGHNGGY